MNEYQNWKAKNLNPKRSKHQVSKKKKEEKVIKKI